MNVLSLGRIHEDQIVCAALQGRQDIRRIALKKGDLFLHSVFPEVLPGQRDPFFVLFYGGDMGIRRDTSGHKKGGKANGCSHLKNVAGTFLFQDHPQK